MTALLVAWPLCAGAETPAPAERVQVSQTAALDPDDPLHQWFKRQDSILDEILVRLSRIEALVRDLHRLISGLPDPAKPTATPPRPTPATAAPAPSLAPPPASATAAPGLIDWALPAAAAALLMLLLLDLRRRRQSSAAPAKTPDSFAPQPGAAPIKKAPPVAPPAGLAKAPPQTPPPSPPATAIAVTTPAAAPPAPSIPLMEGAKDQAIELAEIMLSMGLGHGAAQTLVEQIRREPKQALAQWLKLLEIYRQNGQQAEFEHSAEELRQHFNVQPADWQSQPGAQRSLEDYPHIAARTVELWRKPACLTYLQNLLDDNRGGSRAGFPQSVAEELLLLSAILKADR